MRLILKDYLLQLREKDELDLLLCDLLLQMGYITDTRPKTGNRQYGVDIRAHNSKEILLCVVKQGNIDRNIWDSGPNSIRQSLNEILDVYIEFIKSDLQEKKIHIVITSNGVIEESTRINWDLYKKGLTSWKGVPLKIEFWDIDELVVLIQKYLLSERIFDEEKQGLMRKALYFIGENNYHSIFYESIINSFLDAIKPGDSNKKQEKSLAGLFLASQMIAHYASESKQNKISIMVTEYLIIRYWRFLLANQLFEKLKYTKWLHKFLNAYEKWNEQYFKATQDCAGGPGRFPFYNAVEQKILLYEVLGYWTTYAYWLSFLGEHSQSARDKSRKVCNNIIGLLNNYPQVYYPPYDRHIGVLCAISRLLIRLGRNSDSQAMIQQFCDITAHNFILNKKYPTPDDSFESAVNIEIGLPVPQYQTSAFWGVMMEWLVLLQQKELYQTLQPFLKEDLAEVTKCIWFLRSDEELAFYDSIAMNKAGEGVALSPEHTFEELENTMNFIWSQYEHEVFSYEEYSFEALEFIVCQYYGYIPRVCMEKVLGKA